MPRRRYKVPSMKDVAKLKGSRGLTMVSTFSGCGGSCLGFEMAGYDVLWASEFIPAAQDVYRLNHDGTYLDTRDIREVKAAAILRRIGLKKGELDVLEGSPPCAAFSMCGKREDGWGEVKKYSETKQRVDDLFFEYSRLLEGLKPKAFVAENVPGLVMGSAKGYFKMILRELGSKGYKVKAAKLNASMLGVPQRRQRLIIVGVRKDLGIEPSFPEPRKGRITIGQALEGVKPARGDDVPRSLQEGTILRSTYDMCRKGEGFQNVMAKVRGKSSFFNFTRTHPDKVCPTICQGSQSVLHWEEPRPFNVPELKRLCSFPDDFKLTGSFVQRWERFGRAVPPLMMKAVASHVADLLQGGE